MKIYIMIVCLTFSVGIKSFSEEMRVRFLEFQISKKRIEKSVYWDNRYKNSENLIKELFNFAALNKATIKIDQTVLLKGDSIPCSIYEEQSKIYFLKEKKGKYTLGKFADSVGFKTLLVKESIGKKVYIHLFTENYFLLNEKGEKVVMNQSFFSKKSFKPVVFIEKPIVKKERKKGPNLIGVLIKSNVVDYYFGENYIDDHLWIRFVRILKKGEV